MKMFILEHCPHCKNARNWIAELCQEDDRYKDIEIELIDEEEQAELANSYDYYYVPTIYLDEQKVHEGVATKEKIKVILDQCIK